MTRRNRNASNDHTRAPEVLNALERRKLELDPAIDAWLPQRGETPRNHGMFLMYRDMGRIRTVAQLATMTPMTYASVARIANHNKWATRAQLWDAEQDRLSGLRLLDAREEMAKTHSKAARKLMEKALARLETLKIDTISPHAVALFIEVAARLERSALGLETLNKGASAQQTTVAVTATATDTPDGKSMRVEVGVQHDQIMKTLDEMVSRMSPDQITAGYEELTASAEEASRELDAALPAPPPQ